MTSLADLMLAYARDTYDADIENIVRQSIYGTFPSSNAVAVWAWAPNEKTTLESYIGLNKTIIYDRVYHAIDVLAHYWYCGIDTSGFWLYLVKFTWGYEWVWIHPKYPTGEKGPFIYCGYDVSSKSVAPLVILGSKVNAKLLPWRVGYSPDVSILSPPCGNAGYFFVQTSLPVVIRNQTYAINSAIRTDKHLSLEINAAIAAVRGLPFEIVTAVSEDRISTLAVNAAIQSDISRAYVIRSAIQDEAELDLEMNAAVAINPEITYNAKATIEGHPERYYYSKAAIEGASEINYSIKAAIIVDRSDEILLELEGWIPQEFDLRSTPNWPSVPKDSRKEVLG